jgi:hypothetical protein
MRANAEHSLASGTREQQDGASALIAAIEAQNEADHVALIGELKQLPVAERLLRAFVIAPMTETERKVLKALIDNPGATSEELSRAAGWKDNVWHLHFGTMCFDRSLYLWPAPKSEVRDARFWSGILADFDDTSRGFTMKPDVAQAMEKLGIRPAKGA